LMLSGEIFSAAQTRSPSFSRSSSSTTITTFPARMSATTSSIRLKGRSLSDMIIVFGVEFRHGNVEVLHVAAHGTMTAGGLDHHGCSRSERVDLVVEFDVSFAFEDIVDFRHALVIVRFAIFLDFNEMHRCDFVLVVHEGAPGLSARAGGGL